MKQSIVRAAAAILAVAPFVLPGSAAAAPQTLGLVATNGAVPLKCEDGHCSAEFSSFCLQSERTSPAHGTRYHAYGDGKIQVLATRSDGTEVSLDASQSLVLTAARGHVAVKVSLAPEIAEKLDVRDVAVSIGANVALKPEAVPGDDNPQTTQELALSSGPFRHVGSTYVDTNADRMDAARVTNGMINKLAAKGPYSQRERDRLWQDAAVSAKGISPMARKYARNAFVLCDFTLNAGSNSSLRQCLQQQHDSLLNFLNAKYWKAIGAGS